MSKKVGAFFWKVLEGFSTKELIFKVFTNKIYRSCRLYCLKYPKYMFGVNFVKVNAGVKGIDARDGYGHTDIL